MDKHEKDMAKVKARMKELGYNQRSLSMKATGKPDTVRNWFKGKAKNWRSDNYNAIMTILWPDKQGINDPMPQKPTGFSETETGMMSAIQAMIIILSNYDVIRQADLKNVFSYQQKDFRMRAQPGAAQVMDQLIEFLNEPSTVKIAQNIHKPLSPAQDQSKTGKFLEN